jgi:hypothetical protein
MRAIAGVLVACLLVWAVDAIAARSVPFYYIPAAGSDTLFAQYADTTDVIEVGDCTDLVVVVGAAKSGVDADSISVTTQVSMDETNWVGLTTGFTAVANQAFTAYSLLRNPVAVNAYAAGNDWKATPPARYMRVILTNNSDSTAAARTASQADTLVNYSISVVGVCN